MFRGLGIFLVGMVCWLAPLRAQEMVTTDAGAELVALLGGLTPEKLGDAAAVAAVASAAGRATDDPAASEALSDWLCRFYDATAVTKPGWERLAGLQHWSALLAEHREAAAALKPATRAWLFGDAALTHAFFNLPCPHDRVPRALEILQELHEAEPLRFPAYTQLAVAMALVWSAPLAPVPHHQVDLDKVPSDASTVADRFRFWVETNEKKLADYDLSRLDAGDLKFVVDTAAPLEDLRWAQNTVRFNRGNFERAFFSVKYDEARLNAGQYNWTHEAYSLPEIRKRGGICVDQAYFAATAGKASGIPTLFFTGEGRRGGHAWFGYLRGEGQWVTDCGRYQYDKYATGSAYDAQRGETISDHEIAFLTESFRRTPAHHGSLLHLDQARCFLARGEREKGLAALDAAIKLSPQNLEAWDAKTAALKEEAAAGERLTAHLNAMMIQFTRYADIKSACQNALAEMARASGDTRKAATLEDQVVRENRGKRHDLSAEIFRRQMTEACERGDWAAGRAAVHDAVMKLRNETGTVFDLLNEFVGLALQAGKADEAAKAVADFKGRMTMDPIIRAHLESLQARIKAAAQNRTGSSR